jgi:ankyrin repeat protein
MACRHKDQQLIDAAYEGDLAKVKAKIAAGADVNAKTDEKWSVLVFATCEPETAKILIAAGADVNARDEDGKTAPSTAKENVHDDHIKLLKAAGAQS